MKYIVFDTETDARPNPITNKFTTDQNVIDICWYVVEDGKIIKKYQSEVKDLAERLYEHQPNYNLEHIRNNGKKWNVVFNEFLKDLKDLPDDGKVLAHNLDFDRNVCIYSSRNTVNEEKINEFKKIISEKGICTMRETTNYCKLPFYSGLGYKWPKLTELYSKLYKTEIEQVHKAKSDVEMLYTCVFKLIELQILSFT